MTSATKQKNLNVYELIELANSGIKGIIRKELYAGHVNLNIKPWVVMFEYEEKTYSITFINQKDWENMIKMVGEDSDGNKEFFSVDGEFAELRLA
jgi:hypothetical protein